MTRIEHWTHKLRWRPIRYAYEEGQVVLIGGISERLVIPPRMHHERLNFLKAHVDHYEQRLGSETELPSDSLLHERYSGLLVELEIAVAAWERSATLALSQIGLHQPESDLQLDPNGFAA